MYLYWIHKNLYHGYKNLSVAAMKKNCILQYVSNSLEMKLKDENHAALAGIDAKADTSHHNNTT
jgi:hypothetical protein